jgi:hypothetical protein
LLDRICRALQAPFRPIDDAIDRDTQGENLFQILGVALGETLGVSSGALQDCTAFGDPCVDASLTHRTHRGHDFLQGIDCKIHQDKQQRIFYGSQTGFASTATASLARFLGDMLVIHLGIPRHGKGGQQGVALGVIQARKGAERTGVILEMMRGEHRGYPYPGVLDFALVLRSPLYHYFE